MDTHKAIKKLHKEYLNKKLESWNPNRYPWIIIDGEDREQLRTERDYLETLEAEDNLI